MARSTLEALIVDRGNYNVSAYRVLYILLLLTRYRSLSLPELNANLLENPLIGRAYNSETITKYINTLRRVGCEIPRANSRHHFCYKLMKNPFPLPLTEEEFYAAHRLLEILASQPDEDLHISYSNILRKVAWSVGEEEFAHLLLEMSPPVPDDKIRRYRSLMSRYRKLCKDGQALDVIYEGQEEEEGELLSLEPSRVVQEGGHLYLVGIDRRSCQRVKLDLELIRSYRQLPFKVQSRLRVVSVVFELTGRLAKTYRLYPEETLLAESSDRIRVKARTEDYQPLLKRLLKYGSCCEVISPTYVRHEMEAKVESLLSVLSSIV